MPKIPILLALALFSVTTAHAQLRITEFVADNDGSLLDEDGAASDWIEIHNSGGAATSTAGHFLTDSESTLNKWPLADVTIGPGGYLIVFASSKDRSDPASELHTNFSLGAGGEFLALVAPDASTILSSFAPDYPDQFYGVSYGTGTSGGTVSTQTLVPWPTAATWFVPTSDIGEEWRSPGFDDSAWNAGQTGIGFNYSIPNFIGAGGDTEEQMRRIAPGAYIRVPFTLAAPASVQSMLLKLHFEDGVVAYLNGQEIARDNVADPITFSSVGISALEVFAGDPMDEYPISFAGKLVPGENILGFHMMNNSLNGSDVLLVPEMSAEIQENAGSIQTGYLTSPTPGAPNSAIEFTDFVRDTNFDIDRGFFDSPFDVTITTSTPGAIIVYTTDGSTPTLTKGTQVAAPDDATSPTATVPITTSTPLRAAAFKDGLRPSNVDTQTYLFLDDVLDQPAQPPGYPLPWRQRGGGTIPGDFEMDPDVVGPIYSRDELKAALRDLPTISVVTDIANLFDEQTGIQVNPRDAGEASERRVSVEMIDFADGAPIQLDAGMRMNGNASRSPNRGKHNFRLAFRNEYGAGKLNFPLFGSDAPTETFNQIILRGGNGNSWVHPSVSVRQYAMYVRDQWFRDALFAMGYPEALQREVHVYINGLYFGMHHLFERIEEEWTAERFGGEDEDWEGFRIVGGNNIEVISGTPAEVSARMLGSWQAVLDAAEAGDLPAVEQYLDLDTYIDYMLLNFHAGNTDWDQNNVRAMRRRNPEGSKYMFFCHDAERAGLNALSSPSVNINVTTKNTARGPTQVNTDLRTHANSRVEYSMRFADRAYKHMFNGGALTPENGAAQWSARAERIREAMKAESARWGDHAESTPRTLVDFDNGLNREYDQWFPARTPITIGQLRTTGLYPDIEPPTFSQHGGNVPPGFGLVISNTDGDIYYTTDGSDPRLPGGSANPNAVQLDGSLVEAELVSAGADWLYLDDGTDQGSAWRENDFDDAAWSSGPAALGYGNISGIGALPSLINPEHFLTCYFRKTVAISGADLLIATSVEVMADGGAVVYVNGVEVARDNMPAGAIAFATPSTDDGSPEGQFNNYSFDPSVFVEGDNVIAVELHNSSTSSSDMAIDLRINTVGINPETGSIPIDQTTTILARSLQGSEWSALADATFITGVPASSENLVISELFYNPIGAGDPTEFIELMNISDETISLAGVAFTSGIEFTFPDDAALAPGERLLLVANTAAFEAAFGAGLPVSGSYLGRLDNGGELLSLSNAADEMIQSLRYNDRAPWPLQPDGDGFSLTLIAPDTNPDPGDAESWRASVSMSGSPGVSDATAFSGNTPEELLAYALGSANATIDVELRTIEVNGSLDDYLVAIAPRAPGADDVSYTIEFSNDFETWQSGGAVFLGSAAGDGITVDLAWRAPSPITAPAGPNFARLALDLVE